MRSFRLGERDGYCSTAACANVAGLLPARMVNEFVYCPRLFFYEWVEGVFRESADTVEGSVQHKRVDREGKGLAAAADLKDEKIHAVR